MKDIQLVLVDIDGTLLNDQGMVTPKTIEAHHLQSNISLKSGKLNLMWM